MYLTYFDEVKPTPPDRMMFFIGGIVIDFQHIKEIESAINQVAFGFIWHFGSCEEQ